MLISLISLISLTLMAPALQAQNLSLAKPNEVGVSAEQPTRIGDWMRADPAQHGLSDK